MKTKKKKKRKKKKEKRKKKKEKRMRKNTTTKMVNKFNGATNYTADGRHRRLSNINKR